MDPMQVFELIIAMLLAIIGAAAGGRAADGRLVAGIPARLARDLAGS